MRMTSLLLAAIVLAEVAFVGFKLMKRTEAQTPPLPNVEILDSLTARDLLEMASSTETAEDWHQLGRQYMANGFFPEARSTLRHAATLSPDNGQFVFDYGFCLSRIGELETANQQFQDLIDRQDARSLEATYFLGRDFLRSENNKSAAGSFASASDIPISRYELAKILFRQGELGDATEITEKILRQEPDTIQPSVLLAQIALKLNDLPKAIRLSFQSDHASKPLSSPFDIEGQRLNELYTSIGYGKELSRAYQQIERFENEAARKTLEGLEAFQWNFQTHDAHFQVAKQAGKLDRAVELVEARFERMGPSTQWLSELGQIQYKQGDQTAAVESWKRGIALNSDPWIMDCCIHLTDHFKEVGELDQSKIYEGLGARYRARNAIDQGQFLEAKSFAEIATKLDPGSAEAQYLLGESQLALRVVSQATEAFEQCLKLDPTHGRAQRRLDSLGKR